MYIVNLLRSVLHLLFMAVTVIPWALAVMVAAPFMSSTKVYWMCARWLKLAVDSGTVILGIKNKVIGFENLPTEANAPAVLLVKHQSLWETFCMAALMPHPLAFVFKKELLKVPFFGWAMARMDMIHIDRADGARAFVKVVQQGQRLLDQGTWVIMFPEGTRIDRGPEGHLQKRRYPPGDPHRCTRDSDRRDIGQMLATQGLCEEAGGGGVFHWQAHSERGPGAR